MTPILTEVTAPVVEPVTLAEAKLHSRVDTTADDDYITALIVAARRSIEDMTNLALVEQTWDWVLDAFPRGEALPAPQGTWEFYSAYTEGMFYLPKNPLISVTSIKYIDTSSVEQTWGAGNYTVDTASRVARIYPVYNGEYPTDVRDYPKAVTVRFVTGYQHSGASPEDFTDKVPQQLKQAILLLTGHFYKHREMTEPVVALSEVPWTVRALVAPFKNWSF